LLVAVAIASVVVVGAGRQIVRGERAIAACDDAILRNDAREAIAQARRAAESVLPGSPYPRRGYERLETIAKDAETRGDSATSAAAWRAVRAAAMETRAIGSGSEARIAEANAGLVRAAARDLPTPVALPESLAREDGPTTWDILLLAAAVLALSAAGARFVRRKKA
jgi:hypothetical protein